MAKPKEYMRQYRAKRRGYGPTAQRIADVEAEIAKIEAETGPAVERIKENLYDAHKFLAEEGPEFKERLRSILDGEYVYGRTERDIVRAVNDLYGPLGTNMDEVLSITWGAIYEATGENYGYRYAEFEGMLKRLNDLKRERERLKAGQMVLM